MFSRVHIAPKLLHNFQTKLDNDFSVKQASLTVFLILVVTVVVVTVLSYMSSCFLFALYGYQMWLLQTVPFSVTFD